MNHHSTIPSEKASSANQISYDRSENNSVKLRFECKLLSQMLESDGITCSDDEEQNVLRQFYVVAAARLKRIFDTKRYRERFIFTIRDSNLEANNLPIEEGISTFETLFNDCLGEIMVLISMTQF